MEQQKYLIRQSFANLIKTQNFESAKNYAQIFKISETDQNKLINKIYNEDLEKISNIFKISIKNKRLNTDLFDILNSTYKHIKNLNLNHKKFDFKINEIFDYCVKNKEYYNCKIVAKYGTEEQKKSANKLYFRLFEKCY